MSGAPLVMLVTERRRTEALVDRVRAAAHAGLDYVQVREKDLAGAALAALVREVLAAVRGTAARVLVNGRPDVAVAAGAHGVQLPAAGLPVAAVGASFRGLEIGASCHSAADVEAAAAAGASLVVLGPLFATPGKEERPLGTAAFAAAAAAVRVPVIAIGGLDARSAASAYAAGAAGVAAIRAFQAGDPAAAVRALKEAGR